LDVPTLRFFMSLYSVGPIPIVVRGVLKVLLSDSVWLLAGHLSWIVFHYYFKYFVFSNCTSIINRYTFFCGISQLYTGIFLYVW